jgi:O-antigen/teichoic acid export membrane protein
MTSDTETDSLSIIANEFLIQFIGGILRIALVYVLTIVLTRGLGPDRYGLWVLGTSIQNTLMLFVLLGMPKALYRFIAYYQGTGEPGKTKSLVVEVLSFSLSISVVLLAILLIAPTSILDEVFHQEGIARLLRIIAIGIPFYALLLLLSSCFVGFKRVRYQVLTEGVGLPLIQIIFAFTVFAGFEKVSGIITWAWAYVTALFVVSLASLLLFIRKIGVSLGAIKRVSLNRRTIASYAWPLTLNATLTLLAGQMDFLFLGLFGSSSDVGIYRLYLYFVMPMQIVVTSLARIYQPVVTELVAQNHLAELASVFKRVARWTVLVNIFAALVIFILGKPLTLTLFGEEYLVAPVALSILALGKLLDSSVGPTQMTLEAFGRSRLVLLNSTLVVALQIGLAYFLIPRLGLVGAAIARAFAVSLTNYIELFQVWLLYGLCPFTSSYGWSLLIGILVLAFGYVNQPWLKSGLPILSMSITFLIGALVYWGLILLRVADQEDRRIVGGLLQRLFMKSARPERRLRSE